MPEMNKEKLVEITFSCGLIYVHNIDTNDVVKFNPFQLQKESLKYLSEFNNFFVKAVNAPEYAPVLLSPEAVKAVETIMDFNRIAF